jgi:hypothetical protein
MTLIYQAIHDFKEEISNIFSLPVSEKIKQYNYCIFIFFWLKISFIISIINLINGEKFYIYAASRKRTFNYIFSLTHYKKKKYVQFWNYHGTKVNFSLRLFTNNSQTKIRALPFFEKNILREESKISNYETVRVGKKDMVCGGVKFLHFWEDRIQLLRTKTDCLQSWHEGEREKERTLKFLLQNIFF